MKKIQALALVALLSLAACSDKNAARNALEAQGFTEITLSGYVPFMCGEGDQFSTAFRAKNPNGVYVKGAVCSGFLKGATIRY